MDWSSLSPEQLVQACAGAGSAGASEEFIRRYHTVLIAAAIRVSRQWGKGGPGEVDDIVQEIYLRICADRARLLTNFRDLRPDAMFGYLKVIATHIAHDFFRQRAALKRGVQKTMAIDDVAQIAGANTNIERQISLTEIEESLQVHTQRENGVRDRAVFRLYYRLGMTSQAIAELPGIGLNSKGVEGVLHRLTTSIRKEFERVQENEPRSRLRPAGGS